MSSRSCPVQANEGDSPFLRTFPGGELSSFHPRPRFLRHFPLNSEWLLATLLWLRMPL